MFAHQSQQSIVSANNSQSYTRWHFRGKTRDQI